MATVYYEVTAECVYATVETEFGRTKTLVYKHTQLPEGTPELPHLIASGMVAKVGGEPEPEAEAEPSTSTDGADAPPPADTPPAESAEDKSEAVRAAARAKLPADGSPPHANAGLPVWVEFAVSKGMDRTAAEQADKPALIAALKS